MITPKEYLNKGFNITPCGTWVYNKKTKEREWNEKAPRLKAWEKTKARLEDFTDKDNIGLLLDELCDIDKDNPKTTRFLNIYVKPCSAIYGRKSNPRSHLVFKGKAKHKRYALPEAFSNYCGNFKHGTTLIELRSGEGHQSIVPGSTVEEEPVKWEVFEGVSPYDGDIELDVSKVALSTALSILFPSVGKRNDYGYAIACILAKHTQWSDSEIDQFVKEIADDNGADEKNEYSFLGTHARKQIEAKGKLKMFRTLQNILGLENQNPLHDIFSWIGIRAPSVHVEKLIKDYVYLEDTAEMINVKTKEPYKKVEFDYKHLFDISARPRAFESLLLTPDFQDRKCLGRQFLPNHEYPIATVQPGDHPLLPPGRYFNGYKGNPLEPKKGDVSVFVNTYKQIFGEKNWKHIEQFIGFILQNLGVKIRWGILVVSPEGVGKGILIRTLSRILGYDYVNENVEWDDMVNTHSVAVVDQLLICLNEVVLTGEHSKKMEVSSVLKSFWTDDFCNINEKNKRPYKYLNVCNGFMFSNNKLCLHMDNSSRRYLVIHLDKTNKWLQEFTEAGNFEKLYDVIDSDEGIKAIKHYLIHEVKIKDPEKYKQRAPVTEDLKFMIESSKHPAISKLDRAFEQRLATFNDMFCGYTTLDELMNYMREQWKISYPPEGLIKEWFRTNQFKWKNGKDTRQVVMKDGARPHAHLLRDDDTLRNMTPIELGALHKMDRYEHVKLIGIKHFSFTEPTLFGGTDWGSRERDRCFWYLGNEGKPLIEDLMNSYVNEEDKLRKLRKKYAFTVFEKNYFGKMAKTKKVDWVGFFSDPEYVKIKEEAIKSKNGLMRNAFKEVPEEYIPSRKYGPMTDVRAKGLAQEEETKAKKRQEDLYTYRMEHGLDPETGEETL